MAVHQTFTTDPLLSRVVGQGQPGENFTSFRMFDGSFIGYSAVGNPAVRFSVNVSGQASPVVVDVEVFGQRFFDNNGNLHHVNVTSLEWSLPNSSVVLSRFTFDTPTFWGIDQVLLTAGIVSFINPYTAVGGTTTLALYNAVYQGHDTLTGSSAPEKFYGRAGNDTIAGNGGLDYLQGDSGMDTFVYRQGDAVLGEQIFGGTEIDKVLAVGTGAATNAILQSYAVDISNLTVNGVEEVWVNGTEVMINAPQLSNTQASVGFNVIVGTANVSETLTILRAGGTDFSALQFRTWGAEDTVGLIGSVASETIIGTTFDDAFLGNGGTDQLLGGQGSDNFIFNAGAATESTINGGTFAGTIDQIQINGSGIADLRSASISNVEKLQLLGNTVNLSAAGATQFTQVAGGTNATVDKLNVYVSTGQILRLDDLTFTAWTNGTNAALNDQVNVFGSGVPIGAVGLGATIYGSQMIDKIVGTTGRDTIYAGSGNDSINAGRGADTISGGLGDDVFYVDNDGDVITEALNQGLDTALSSITYSLAKTGMENVENLTLTGTAATAGTGNLLKNTIIGNSAGNTLNGGGSNDALEGAGGNDALDGGIGNDILDGGEGFDTLRGGGGNDTFRFDYRSESAPATPDRIMDFNLGDKIDVRGIEYELGDPLSFIGTTAFSGDGNSAQIRYQAITGGIQVQINRDNDFGPEFSVNVMGITSISDAAFIHYF